MKNVMKIMAVVLFVASLTALPSCNKSKEKAILGKWRIESISVSYGGQSFQMTIEELAAMFGDFAPEDDVDIVLDFKDDGYVYYQDKGVRYTIVGDKLTIAVEEDEMIEGTITELTSKKMTLEGTEVDDETGMKVTFGVYFRRV